MKISTYIKLLKKLNSIPLCALKGYDELDDLEKSKLSIVSGTISNELGD